MKKEFVAFAATVAAFATPAMALEGSVGAGVHAFDFGYRGMDIETYAVPAVSIETDHFYWIGFSAGAYLLKTDSHRVRLGVSYMPTEFDAGDSDNRQMKMLDDRDASVFANIGYAWHTDFGILNVDFGGDISGKSDGLKADVSYLKRFDFGRLGITPQVGFVWTNDKFDDYYYGVSKKESAKSGIAAYNADGGVSPYARVVADYFVTNNILVYAEASARSYSKEIKDSPMMEDDIMYGFGCGVSYLF